MVNRRDIVKAGFVVTAAGTAAGCATSGGGGSDRKNFVLVHGAWHGGWCWEKVAQRLSSAGHRVFMPTQTGLGERRHLISANIDINVFIEDVVNVIEAEELSDVILVGHSFGGLTITGVADRVPKTLRHLVYLDALIVPTGGSVLDFFPPNVAQARIKAAQDFSGGVSLPAPSPEAFAVTNPADVAWLKRRLTPHPFSTYRSKNPLRNPVGNGVAATYIVCTAPLFPPQETTRQWVRANSGWKILELPTGHDAMVTAPGPLAEMLLGIG